MCDVDRDGYEWLLLHSGSHLGLQSLTWVKYAGTLEPQIYMT